MRWIAHRGNMEGPSAYENHPEHLHRALDAGFDVECDVWMDNGEIVLGHDRPLYCVDTNFLQDYRIWCHCKNVDALVYLQDIPSVHYFFHHTDPYTLTSQNYIWVYPGYDVPRGAGILVMPESAPAKSLPIECAGVCSDYVKDYKEGF
jgi:hypothetical protein